MTDAAIVLLAALVGAAAGVIGAAVGALAALRSSQLAARVALAPKVHALAQAVVHLNTARGKPDYSQRMKEFQIAWNDLIVHQKILLPSKRLNILNEIVRDAPLDPSLDQTTFPLLAGDALSGSTDIIAAHSQHMFRWRAQIAERGVTRDFKRRVSAYLKSAKLKALTEEL